MKMSEKLPTLTVIDIGASGGIDERWKNFSTQGVLVEPDPREVENLKRSLPGNYCLITSALSDKKGKKIFYLYRKQQSSSFNPPNSEFTRKFPESERLEVVSEIELETDTLDAQLLHSKIQSPDVIKIDVEGHELPILKGGIKAVEQILALEAEVNFAELRKGVPTFTDLDIFLREKGLTLIDIRKTYWLRKNMEQNYTQKGQLILGDVLYFVLPEIVVEKYGNDAQKCYKALLVYLAYGYLDLALELNALCANKIWSKEISESAAVELSNFHSKSLPALFSKILLKVSRKLQNWAGYTNWYTGDSKLGN